ncbi:MAG: hypothetical protein HYS06_11555 [Methylocystis sp.]|nr:hypothetical protein [Methylocystis sp.]MBI3275593.1 hypothetical protein [Methylocystis sp.]
MTRRYITSIVTAIAIAASGALAFSGPAEAHMGYRTGAHYGWHYGWHKGWTRSFARYNYVTPAFYGNTCYQQQWVSTMRGWRLRWVNSCNTGLFGGGIGFGGGGGLLGLGTGIL